MQKFFTRRIRYYQQGFTAIEVLVVLVLLAVVMTPAVNAIGLTNRIWSHNEAINPSITQANVAMTYISREIREAAQPSSAVDSVTVEDEGQRLVIYRYNENNNQWEKIIYQTTGNKLDRINLAEDDPQDIIDASIPEEDDLGWKTLVEGVTSDPVFNRSGNSKAVEVNLQVSDSSHTNARFSPYTVASTYMVRSREVGAITGDPVPDETEAPVVAVYKVELDDDEVTLIIDDSSRRQRTLSVTFWPVNANTGKSVTWTSSKEDWVKVTPIDSNHARIEMVKTTSDLSYWLGWKAHPVWLGRPGLINSRVQIKATPENGQSAICYVKINSK